MLKKLTFTVIESQAEVLSDWLSELGALAIEFSAADQQEIFEPKIDTTPLWEHTQVNGLFPEETDVNAILEQLNQLCTFNLAAPTVEKIPEKNWVEETQRLFQPMSFGSNLWICPSWNNPPEKNAINIFMDPGIAFGTGTHPTTALCLTWLAENPPTNKAIIDYGCGSGILGIAAKKLGASKVWATDIDPQAITATEMNTQRNDIDGKDFFVTLPETTINWQADLLIANILAQPLIELADLFHGLLHQDGKLLLSGLLEKQSEQVLAAYKNNFKLIETKIKTEWVCLLLQKT